MAGTGYNIPISVSAAQTLSMPQSASTPTYFLFSSPGSSFGAVGSEANPIAPATATSSAAEGNAASSSQGSGVGTQGGSSATGGLFGSSSGGINKTVLVITIAAVVTVLGAAIILRHR